MVVFREQEKYIYRYEEYWEDIKLLKSKIIKEKPSWANELLTPHIVGIYRGSLTIAAHLSNILECGMSIVRFQSRDGDDKEPEFLLDLSNKNDQIIIVDDIYDSGKTFRAVKTLFYDYHYVKCLALFGKHNYDNVTYLHENLGKWVVFPWERSEGEM